ncbi:MAG: hypothetical protein HUK20_11780 [Fibrobacter sp.]|nr:hypothetical protein [Fibrobacter sp.]
MKDEETKAKFIELRASGKSLRKCASQLHIAKSTCGKWDKDLAMQVANRKNERLDELYKEYGMVKEARITALGDMIKGLGNAIQCDMKNGRFYHLTLEKKIELWLKLRVELMKEYTPATAPIDGTDANAMRSSFMAFMMRVQSGEVAPKDMKVQAEAFAAMMVADKATKPDLLGFGF